MQVLSRKEPRRSGFSCIKVEEHYASLTWNTDARSKGMTATGTVLFKLNRGEYREFVAALERLTRKKTVATRQLRPWCITISEAWTLLFVFILKLPPKLVPAYAWLPAHAVSLALCAGEPFWPVPRAESLAVCYPTSARRMRRMVAQS